MDMETKKCLSVRNPWGYLICAGLKDVENRTWKTDYRGELYIHASGQSMINCLVPGHRELLPVHYEAEHIDFADDGGILRGEGISDYIVFDGKKYFIRADAPEEIKKEFDFLMLYSPDAVAGRAFLRRQAIIGKCVLADVVKDSKSKWAVKGQYHWILRDQELFDSPILYVKGMLKIFDYRM